MILRRIPLKTVENLRDLGGYACSGGATRFGAILRSAVVSDLSTEDMNRLISMGLTDIIDLRSDSEHLEYPNAFEDHASVKLHRSGTLELSASTDFTCMGDAYIYRIDNMGEYHRKIIEIVANAEGTVLIHCFAGKDRTGIMCALILLLLGVDPLDVIADYQITHTYIRHYDEAFLSAHPNTLPFVLSSTPSNMIMTIRHITEKYGSAKAYLTAHGLDGVTIEKLKSKFVIQ